LFIRASLEAQRCSSHSVPRRTPDEDDATRLAYAEVLGDEKGVTAVGFLRRALAFSARHGIQPSA
jgi:hypothetical protein